MKQLLLDIVNSIVDHPEKVKLDESTDSEGTLNFTLTVDPEDMGKIIGKEGKVIKSIRTIIRIPAIKQDKKVNLELTEQDRVEKEGSDDSGKQDESSEEKTEGEDKGGEKSKEESKDGSNLSEAPVEPKADLPDPEEEKAKDTPSEESEEK